MYADGTKSNDVELGEIKTASASWLSILPSEADAGVATLYIYDVNSKKLVEKYSFTIK
jgi:hypothetical protein